MKKLFLFLTTISVMILLAGCKPEKPDKMAWWHEARFGMFIHWGIYSVPAGVYHGKDIPGIGEWIMNNAKIPVAEYKEYATEFNPVDFDADKWVKMAKDAGMRYIVITSKHHDGFAMFKSSDPFNIVDATPYKKDIIKAIADACKKYDMHFGLYYSQAQDWTHPGGAACQGHWDPAQDGSFDEYLTNVSIPQVKEVLSRYHPEILWWDTPCEMDSARAARFLPLIAEYPNLIINNRLGGGVEGDFATPEQTIPATGIPGKNWEACMTMNDTWGYKVHDHNWKNTKTLVRNLIDIASKGGNYLLNVGPTSKGLIPEASVLRLKQIGSWMKVNGEAIYGVQPNPFKQLKWGRCTRKIEGNKLIMYFHIFDYPDNDTLIIPGLAGKIYKAYPLSDKNRELEVIANGNNPEIVLSGITPDSLATVIAVVTDPDIKIYNVPEIEAAYDVFIDTAFFRSTTDVEGATIRYTTDGTVPDASSSVSQRINKVVAGHSFTVKAACFVNGEMVSGITEQHFEKVDPLPATKGAKVSPGLACSYYEGQWDSMPDFNNLKAVSEGICGLPDISLKEQDNNYGFLFSGYLEVPETGVYQILLSSDDGSVLILDGKKLSNGGLHAMQTKTLNMALEKGLHPVEIQFMQAGGDAGLTVEWMTGDNPAVVIPAKYWKH